MNVLGDKWLDNAHPRIVESYEENPEYWLDVFNEGKKAGYQKAIGDLSKLITNAEIENQNEDNAFVSFQRKIFATVLNYMNTCQKLV